MIELSFIKRINTNRSSIFYSLIHYNNQILGFCRKTYESYARRIRIFGFSTNFDITLEYLQDLRGEDPRCFIHKDKLYVVDNYCDDIHLIDYDSKEYIKIPLSGKNFSFISHEDNLYIIHSMVPLSLYTFNIPTRTLHNIVRQNDSPNKEYRGGTPGYHKEHKTYYGFGHRTHNTNQGLTHDLYYWELNFDQFPPELKIENINQPLESKTITDPTSIISIDDTKYLITAESDYPWQREQDYITNVYRFDYSPDQLPPPEIVPEPKISWKTKIYQFFSKFYPFSHK